MKIDINNIESPNTEVKIDEQRSDSGKSPSKKNIKSSDKAVESLQPAVAEKPGKLPEENSIISVSNQSVVENTESVSKHPELAQNVDQINSERQNPELVSVESHVGEKISVNDKKLNFVKTNEIEKLQIKISATQEEEPMTSQNNNSNKNKPEKEDNPEVKESTQTAAEKSETYNPREDPNALENFKVEWEEPVTDSETGSDSDGELEEVPESGKIISQESAPEKTEKNHQTNEIIMYGMTESLDENEIVFHCSTCQDRWLSPLKKVGFLKIDHLLKHYKGAHGKTDTNK